MLAASSFSEVAASLGLTGMQGGSGEFHAGGLTFTDLTNDGYADLYLIGPASTGNRLYVNVDDGQGGRTFVRVAGDGGTGYSAGNSTGSVAADYDNDGDLDIYLTNFRSTNILFRNMWMEDHPTGVGDPTALRFTNATFTTDPTPAGDNQHGVGLASFDNPDAQFGNDILNSSMAAAWADVNRDGWIDLFVGSWDGTNGDPATAVDGQLGERDTLYLNNGDGTFTDVTMGLDGAPPQTQQPLLVDDGSFESATPSSSITNSDWVLTTEAESAVFQQAGWAASDQAIGVWFQGFRGSAQSPADAVLTQTITVPETGDYTLTFDARVEANFAETVGAFQATLVSSGTGGSDGIDLIAESPNTSFNSHSLSLSGVTAGDTLTIRVEMLDAIGLGGAARSAMVDAFFLQGVGDDTGWEQVGGWQYFDGSYNDPSLPAEFSGHNALQFADFNNDGWQDLIVATMGGGGVGPNRDMLYMNRGIDEEGRWLGYHMVSYEIGFGGTESSDMGVAVADIENDGDLDYFSTLLPAAHPIWINDFADSGELGFTRTTIQNDFAWGANFHDFDNNGRVDLLVGTANGRRSYLHMQELDGGFNEQAIASGITTTDSVRGVAVADFDRDGWSDTALWYINGNSPGIGLYQNDSATQNASHHFLTLELEGDPTLPGQFKTTRDAIGTRAYVTADFDGDGMVEADETRIEEVLSGHSNASTTSSLALEFGLGEATTADVRIEWSSGRVTELLGVAADQFLAVKEEGVGADFDFDNDVDLFDLLALQRGYGEQAPDAVKTDGDADDDQDVDGDDLIAWESQFVASLQQASSSSEGSAPSAAAFATASMVQASVAESADPDEAVIDEEFSAEDPVASYDLALADVDPFFLPEGSDEPDASGSESTSRGEPEDAALEELIDDKLI